MPSLPSQFPGNFSADLSFDAFSVSVQEEIARLSGLDPSKVIWEFQTTARPARPFIALSVIEDHNPNLLGEDSIRDNPAAGSDTDNVAQIFLDSTDRPEVTVRCMAFSDAPKAGAYLPAVSILKRVRAGMGGDEATDNLDPIVVLDRTNVQNVSVMLETAYEGRAVLDLKFGTMETNEDSAGIIDTVLVEVTVKDTDGSTIVDETITLPNS